MQCETVPGKPEVPGRTYIWTIGLIEFDDFARVERSIEYALEYSLGKGVVNWTLRTSDEKKLLLSYLIYEELHDTHPLVLHIGGLCNRIQLSRAL